MCIAGRKATWSSGQVALRDRSGSSTSVTVAVETADLSVVDHIPEELLNLTATGAHCFPRLQSTILGSRRLGVLAICR